MKKDIQLLNFYIEMIHDNIKYADPQDIDLLKREAERLISKINEITEADKKISLIKKINKTKKNKLCPYCETSMIYQDDSFDHEFGTQVQTFYYCEDCEYTQNENHGVL